MKWMFVAVTALMLNIYVPAVKAKELNSFRCGNALVEVGMNIVELIESCKYNWVPSEIRTRVKHYTTQRDIVHFVESMPATANTYQYWVYRTPGKFNTWLWITDGYITRIVYGDRH